EAVPRRSHRRPVEHRRAAGAARRPRRQGPHRQRRSRRSRHRQRSRHARGDPRAARRRQRGRRVGRRRRRAGRHRAVLRRHRRRRLHGHLPRLGQARDHDRPPRALAADHARRRLHGERQALGLQRRPLQRSVGGCPGNRARLGSRPAPLRHVDARPRAGARRAGRASRLPDRSDLLRHDRGQPDLLRRRHLHSRPLPRLRRHAARRRHQTAQPATRPHLPGDRQARATGVLPRAHRRGDGAGGGATADRRGRRAHLATRPDDPAGPAPLPGARAGGHPRRLSRIRRLRHGAAVERRHHGRRGAQHPRGLRPARRHARRRAAPLPRGLATGLRRPQCLCRGPVLLRRPGPRAAVGLLRRRASRADRPGRRQRRRRRREPLRQPGRRRAGDAGERVDRAQPVDHPPGGLRSRRQRRVIHVHHRVDRWQRHRRAEVRLPAQQRADRLQLRLDDAPQSRPGRQAAAQLDGADDRPARRAPGAGGRLARRLDHHHHRPADRGRPSRPADAAAAGARRAAGGAAKRRRDGRGAGLHQLGRGAGAGGGALRPPPDGDHPAGDRGRHRARVRAARPRAGRCGADASRWRVGDGRAPAL
ncbi:MAG: Gamma-glutamyltranspeptidase @ Glutathione hydrolase, partial [uncultured Solirubrobacteraceae bacterium]